MGFSPYGVDRSPRAVVTTCDFNLHVPSKGFPSTASGSLYAAIFTRPMSADVDRHDTSSHSFDTTEQVAPTRLLSPASCLGSWVPLPQKTQRSLRRVARTGVRF